MTTYVKRLHRFFNVDAAGEYFTANNLLPKQDFDQAIKDTVKVRRLYLEGFDWLLMDQLFGSYPQVPYVAHCQALSAGLGRPFEGAQDLYRVLSDLELIPVSVLNRTQVAKMPTEPGRFGDLAEQMGFVSSLDQQRALGIQRMLTDLKIRTCVGQVFRAMGRLSVPDFFQVLSVQTGVPFTTLDASAPAIWQASAQRPLG